MPQKDVIVNISQLGRIGNALLPDGHVVDRLDKSSGYKPKALKTL